MARDYSRDNSSYNKPRQDNREIAKVYQELIGGEKKIASRRLKARALCTHTRSPQQPHLTYKKDSTGKMIWVCRICGQEMDMAGMTDEKLIDAIKTVTSAIDFIKMMTNGSEKDTKLVNEVLSEIEFLSNAYLLNAYRAARNSSSKKSNDDRRVGGHRTSSVWEG